MSARRMLRGLVMALALLPLGCAPQSHDTAQSSFTPPPGSTVTALPPLREGKAAPVWKAGQQLAPAQRGATLVIEAATDISLMRPFLDGFRAYHPDLAILYVDMLSTQLLGDAQARCARGHDGPDLFISVATDHLVKLANDGCAQAAGLAAPDWREWRGEVYAFALEPAVFVYNRRLLAPAMVPDSHAALAEQLRDRAEALDGHIATYDIRQSGLAYNYAEFDSREAPLYGRLIESFGRGHIRLYCCSNTMVDAVARGDVLLAYNVQLSYAYAAQRRHEDVGVIVPRDYQAVQTRSAMVAKDAVRPDLARSFLAFLISPEGQSIASRILTPPVPDARASFTPSERLLSQANVSSSLLRLQDQARRKVFLQEWLQAIVPAR